MRSISRFVKQPSSPIALLLVVYSLFYITTSFLSSNTVLLQTLYNLMIIAFMMMLIKYIHKSIQPLFYAFWIGQAVLYLINFFAYYKDVDAWLANFNSYPILVSIYTMSILFGLLFIKK